MMADDGAWGNLGGIPGGAYIRNDHEYHKQQLEFSQPEHHVLNITRYDLPTHEHRTLIHLGCPLRIANHPRTGPQLPDVPSPATPGEAQQKQ